MPKVEEYRAALRTLADWDAYLLAESHLPGPRGNLELAQAVADEGDARLFHRLITFDAAQAPTNSPREFLAFCGVLGLGTLLAAGDRETLPLLRQSANDPRWRTREAVAMALQRWGDADMAALLAEMRVWSGGTLLERRAVVAGLCEPRLLRQPDAAAQVLDVLDGITRAVQDGADRQGEAFQALRKALGYGWSVAVVAHPAHGRRLMAAWFASVDKDIRWIMRENLGKNRLRRMDAAWVDDAVRRMAS